jgi:dTDP-4-dehydrorhamnose 3,5-epimerase
VIFTKTPLSGAYVIDLEYRGDERGHFARTFCAEEFAAHDLITRFVQANTSRATQAGTIRGLHYQIDPAPEAKLMRCTKGAIFDVIVDMREDSATWGQWFGVELTEENRRALYVPEHFAHGFLTLKDDTEVHYMVSAPYTPHTERGVRYDDPTVGIRWPITPKVVSDKDRTWPLLSETQAGSG